MRLACLFVPDLAVQATLRRSPDLRGCALALVESARGPAAKEDGVRGRSKVVLASVEARRHGVRPGMTAAQAAAACPDLALQALSAADVDAAEAALADVGFAFAARIDREPGRVFLDVGDLGRLYPSEAAVTQAIQARAIRVGLGVRVA